MDQFGQFIDTSVEVAATVRTLSPRVQFPLQFLRLLREFLCAFRHVGRLQILGSDPEMMDAGFELLPLRFAVGVLLFESIAELLQFADLMLQAVGLVMSPGAVQPLHFTSHFANSFAQLAFVLPVLRLLCDRRRRQHSHGHDSHRSDQCSPHHLVLLTCAEMHNASTSIS